MSQLTLKQLDIAQVFWLLRRVVNQLGLLGLIGVCLMLFSILFGVKAYALNQALTDTQQQLNQSNLNREENREESTDQQEIEAVSLMSEFLDFYETVPSKSNLSHALLTIKETATKHKLALNQGNYKFTLVSKGKDNVQHIAQYEIKLPFSGNYVQMRTFINDVLLALPTLALSDVNLKRESIRTSILDANLTFIFFARNDK